MIPRAILFWADDELWLSRVEDGFPTEPAHRLVKDAIKGHSDLNIAKNEIHLVEYDVVEGDTLALYNITQASSAIILPRNVQDIIDEGKFRSYLRKIQDASKIFTLEELSENEICLSLDE